MIQYILRRILATVPVVLGVCTVTFLLLHLVPGDPVDIMLGEQAAVMDKEALRRELGLDLPLHVQYGHYLQGLVTLDIGRSLHSRLPVSEEVAERIPATVELTLGSILLALLFGIPMGILAAVRQYSWIDNSVLVSGLLGMSIPGFFLGPLLIWIFALHLDIFPVSERGGIEHLVLPAISLALPFGAILMRMTRASMLDVIKEEYINVARAKGLHPVWIYAKHALANALMPIITIVGLQMGALLTGTVITETIFDWPGIGTLLFQSI
ncbi:MAG: ABC transporter permease, partial [Bdellovibrionales bacterium]|nr:ABC transporter permease [Bdellovibrionales bacterium]